MIDETQAHLYDQLQISVSAERLHTYLQAAGYDKDRALRLYLWNAAVGEAFHLPIQAAEVALRNGVNRALCAAFGPEWWQAPAFVKVADRNRVNDLDTARRRITGQRKPITTAQIVASLSFGFWVRLLEPRYAPSLWGDWLRPAFPALPDGKTRPDLASAAQRTADLRNRIWHHEPVFRLDLSTAFHGVMELLRWICPLKAQWIRPFCHVPVLLRGKP